MTVLVDTSVWVEHLRRSDALLAGLLTDNAVFVHPFVLGELACGNLKHRERILESLGALPSSVPASEEEVLRLVGSRGLYGQGIGWVDAHLVASALLSGCALWTRDERLRRASGLAGVSRFQ